METCVGIHAGARRQLLDNCNNLMVASKPMGKIPEKNARFRTKEQIVADIVVMLKANITYGTRYAVLADVAWVWSEYHGKYGGCRYWSKRALGMKDNTKTLCHEHIVPKKVIIDKILALKSPTKPKVNEILERYCIGCVVTRDEDKKLIKAGLRSAMPGNWDGVDPWARYKNVGIKVVELHDVPH